MSSLCNRYKKDTVQKDVQKWVKDVRCSRNADVKPNLKNYIFETNILYDNIAKQKRLDALLCRHLWPFKVEVTISP